MMLPWRVDEVAALAGGRLTRGNPATRVRGVSIDSRTLRRGDLFVAVRGARTDGHRFVRRALARGAAAVAASRPAATGGKPLVRVADTARALLDLARARRLSWGGPLVAVTGSAGKTTVKDLAAHLLSEWFRVLATEGNLNNQFGLPLTLMRLTGRHEAAVVEIGINRPGEMALLAEAARPDVAVVTAVGSAHLGFFRGRAHLASEKLKIAQGLREGGTLVVPVEWKDRAKAERRISFGVDEGDVRARDVRTWERGSRFRIVAGGTEASAALPLPGRHNVQNALAAVAAGLALGASLGRLAAKLASFRPRAAMRLEFRSRRGVLFVNDAYNASPEALRAALETFRAVRVHGRKAAVLGDMLELGRFGGALHRGALAATLAEPLDLLVLVGRAFPRALREAAGRPSVPTACFETAREAGAFLSRELEPGDAVLLKASRGLRLERVLEAF